MTVQIITELVVPVVIASILLAALVRRIPAFDVFCKGAAGGFGLVLSTLPYIVAILIAVSLLRACGVTALLVRLLSPVLNAVGIPPELSELVILRPLSGSGSLALYNELIASYGADSYACRCASVMMASSDTVLYVAGVYLSAIKAKKLSYCIPVALVATAIGTIASCLVCRIL